MCGAIVTHSVETGSSVGEGGDFTMSTSKRFFAVVARDYLSGPDGHLVLSCSEVIMDPWDCAGDTHPQLRPLSCVRGQAPRPRGGPKGSLSVGCVRGAGASLDVQFVR